MLRSKIANVLQCGKDACFVTRVHVDHWKKGYGGLAWELTVLLEYMHHSLPIRYRLRKAKGHLPQYVNVMGLATAESSR